MNIIDGDDNFHRKINIQDVPWQDMLFSTRCLPNPFYFQPIDYGLQPAAYPHPINQFFIFLITIEALLMTVILRHSSRSASAGLVDAALND